jgi:hypothetical protein
MYRNHRPGSGKTPYYYCVGAYPARTSTCKLTVRCEELEAAVDDYIAQLNLPIMKQAIVPGRDYHDEIDEIEQKIVDLSLEDLDDDTADARLHELRAERRRLRALEPEPDHVELLTLDETYAERWTRLNSTKRGSWLRQSNVRVHASRDLSKVMSLLAQSRTADARFPHGLVHAGDVFAVLIIDRLRP